MFHKYYHSKKTVLLITIPIIAVCAAIVVYFSAKSNNKADPAIDSADKEMQSVSFLATIVEIGDNTILVQPAEGSTELSSSDCFSIPIKYMPASHPPKTGDVIQIQYNGEILESYPAQLGQIYDISFSDAKGDDESTHEL